MPRKAKPRDPASNRSDLRAKGRPQAVTVPTGLGYGERQALEASQSAMPLPGDPFQAAIAEANASPTELLSLLGPTARPDEPVTAGLPMGPGPGPEILGGPSNRASDTLDELAAQTGDQALALLAMRARSRGF